jgi:multidrug efflux pump subunit AcrA (membrane-fusion protein)
MKKIIYRHRYIFVILLILAVLGGAGIWYFSASSKPTKTYTKPKKIWQTVSPKIAKDFSSIKIVGKVKSNGFAIISPRRSGIVQDLLVDIGDAVTKGQTIGSMLPDGVEGQSSAAIAESLAKLQKTRAELEQAQAVATDSVGVATKQWRETSAQVDTKSTLDTESQRQLTEKKSEGRIVATQAWESTKVLLFGTGSNALTRSIVGSFSDSIQENNVKNLAADIQRMEQNSEFEVLEVVEHLNHIEKFLVEVEFLYKNAQDGRELTATSIEKNLTNIQQQQLKVSRTKQSILALEEKKNRLTSEQAEKKASLDRSLDMIDLVSSQQNLSLTQAEKNVSVALANYNGALVKSGHQKITSPFDGVITARMVEVGQAVTMNQAIFYLEGVPTARSKQTGYEIHFSMPESWKNILSISDPIRLKTVDTDETLAAKIFRVSEQINTTTNSIMATAIIDLPTYNRDIERASSENKSEQILTHGQNIFVYLQDTNSQKFSVPTPAIKKRGTDYFVWKMIEKTPVQVAINLIAEDGEFSQIFAKEISIDDQIIRNPSVSLFK